MPQDKTTRVILVTGGNGFIGSHVARRLHGDPGNYVRIADIVPCSHFSEAIGSEFIVGNLCDRDFCRRIVQGVDTVLHFAATMGGMGTIHSANDFIIYTENNIMALNILDACLSSGVKRFLYASSACVYPESLQATDNKDISLREEDVWSAPPPKPQGLYGLEKLATELLLLQYESKLEIRIARFHNVYGPRGAWYNGREKAPAALIRKALAGQMLGVCPVPFEIWGDGTQRRSFLYIEDCVDAVLRLLKSACNVPINVGTDRAVSIQDLAYLSLQCAGIAQGDAQFLYYPEKPVGVASRNSNNEFVQRELEWTPQITLENGMKLTANWIKGEMNRMVSGLDDAERRSVLSRLQSSELVDLNSDGLTFAIILPVTSRGSETPGDCLQNLRNFAQSLIRTTWRDTHSLGGNRYHIKVYLAIDENDVFIWGSGEDDRATTILRSEGITDIVTVRCNFPPGHVCSIWRYCARRAWADGCHYFVLVGDDVVLQDEGWMRNVHEEFVDIGNKENVPHGIGCVAFTDTSFPGMPTFPIIHRTHMDIFNGEVVPEVFINQDGDPFLYQLYRRWGCSRMFDSRIRNKFGGTHEARYVKQHAVDWSFGPLDMATSTVEDWLSKRAPAAVRKLTLDVVIPCYRVQLRFLEPILQLQSSPTCTVMFIIIIDDPNSPNICELEHKYAHRPDVRIRINQTNMGASASRNRGMRESAAEWIHFLDDDVSPQQDLLVETEKYIRASPTAAGFVGNAQFPSADTIFTAAVHLAGVTYFWDIATKIQEDLPWGVTANLIARRMNDDIEYDLQFPKTGGGEDIDFCRKKRQFSMANGGEGFNAGPGAIVTHPWWYEGARSYWRFYMWSKGDGGLVRLYPEHTYYDVAPNSAEMFLISSVATIVEGAIGLFTGRGSYGLFGMKIIAAILFANILHDIYRHMFRDIHRTKTMKTTVGGIRWFVSVIESSLIRMASEAGRVIGMLERGEGHLLGRRFDWFTGRAGKGPMNEERKNSREKLVMVFALVAIAVVM